MGKAAAGSHRRYRPNPRLKGMWQRVPGLGSHLTKPNDFKRHLGRGCVTRPTLQGLSAWVVAEGPLPAPSPGSRLPIPSLPRPPPAAGERGAACGKALCINYAHDAAAKKIQVAEGGKKRGEEKGGVRKRGEEEKYIYLTSPPPPRLPLPAPWPAPLRPAQPTKSPSALPSPGWGPGGGGGSRPVPGPSRAQPSRTGFFVCGRRPPGPRPPVPQPGL